MRLLFILSSIAIFVVTSCSSIKHADLDYLNSSYELSATKPTLNIFQPKDSTQQHDVLIFVHGGNWDSGSKGTYSILGRNFAKKDFVTVIPGYTLSPFANYDIMPLHTSNLPKIYFISLILMLYMSEQNT